MSPITRQNPEFFLLSNEFAAVRVSVDERGNSPRLLVEDVETGASILLSPIELASFCLADPDDRLGWLRVGQYREERAHRWGPAAPTGLGAAR